LIDYWARRIKRVWHRTLAKPGGKPAIGRIRCREITPDDLDPVVDLLTEGFWRSSRDYWMGAIGKLTEHPTPEGYPKYGYVLENDGTAVGVLLTIFTARVVNGETRIWCNESSYYVKPWFRFYAPLLVQRAHKHKNVTYLDLTPSAKTLATLGAQGYERIAFGVYATLAFLCRPAHRVQIRKVDEPSHDVRLESSERDLLNAHARFQRCISLICDDRGNLCPFVFVLRSKYGIPFAFLLYSRSHADFVRFAGQLGRFLLRQGIPLILLDADRPITGIPGKFLKLYPKFWKGQEAPRLGDLAYTEIALFGVI
jgi:hypothetical protein